MLVPLFNSLLSNQSNNQELRKQSTLHHELDDHSRKRHVSLTFSATDINWILPAPSNGSNFSIKLSDDIDVLHLLAPFLLKYRIYTYDSKGKSKDETTRKWKYEMSYIPHKVDLVLEQHEKHKNRYRLSLVIIDAAGIRMQENQPIMLSHDGLQRQNVPEKSNTFYMHYNDRHDEETD
ncbi:unnamed protein product [Rotaria magnacalcarata]|nr:unnamed protein product [Rotaria magnacalcarata]